MNTFVWILQGIIAFVFLFSGLNKAYYDEKTLVKKGQTGVEGLPKAFIQFIGVAEILGAFGLVLPAFLHTADELTPISSICLGLIMIPAAVIHTKRKEFRNVVINISILMVCLFIGYHRMG